MRDAEPLRCSSAIRRRPRLIRPLAAGAGVPRVETLGARGDGSLAQARCGCRDRLRHGGRGDDDLAAHPLHLGHHRPLQGRDAEPRQPGLQRFTLRDDWRFTADDVLLHALPIFHTHGLFVAHQRDRWRPAPR